MMRWLLAVFFLVMVAGWGAGYFFDKNSEWQEDLSDWREAVDVILDKEFSRQELIRQEVAAPEPLRGPVEREVESYLTVSGVVMETNNRRMENGLAGLTVNAQLNLAAEMKVDDMFDRQYFEHDSPTGEGPGDLARQAGYRYLIVGENLALGNYEDDKALVEAWMNSPGHRENILNDKYTEIGVALKRGVYEGQTVWMAVQEFGRPASLCPNPSEEIKDKIEEKQDLLAEIEVWLRDKEEEINNMRPKRGAEYNKIINEYNKMVERYNALLDELQILISEYNAQVQTFNRCIDF